MNRIVSRIAHHAKRIVLRNSPASHRRGRAIMKFAASMGFVYFGSVDQHSDDHHIIRGLTVSSTHQDNHYTVGSMDGYDISIVDRLDETIDEKNNETTHDWLIFEIDLHSGTDIPHIFLEPQTGSTNRASEFSKLFAMHTALQRVPLGTFQSYSPEFLNRYVVFAAGSHFIESERYFDADTTSAVAAHFWPFAIEIFEGALYIYASKPAVTHRLLETMLRSGLWLAAQLDGSDERQQ